MYNLLEVTNMEQGLNFENGQIIRYSDGLAKIVLNYEQTQAVELLIKKYMSKETGQNH